MTPQTKTFVGIAALIIIVGGGFFFLRTGRSEIKYSKITPEQASKAVEVLSRDQDNDGLKDWEEELWKTDVLNPDTDGDKTNDGAEIKLGRDPLKAGPDDKLDKGTIEQKTVPGGGDWTETDRLSREFFAKYMSIKQSGAPFTAEDELKLLEEFASRPTETTPQKTYTESDIIFAKTDDATSWRAYGNAIGAVINAHQETNAENELVIFERAMENEDEADLSSLQGRIKRYESMLSGFKKVPVPAGAKTIHLELLRSVQAIRDSVEGMSLALKDPVHALPRITAYPKAFQDLTDTLGRFGDFFEKKHMAFEKNEPGSILVK